jgi:hypothetical protein
MTRFLARHAGLLAASALLLSAAPAAAQGSGTGAVDVGIGYQYLRAPDSQSYPLGFNADVTGPFLPGLRWVGEAGLSRDRERDDDVGVTSTLTAIHYAGGVRFAPGRGRWPYAQLLVGRHRDGLTVNANDIGDIISESRSTTMLQPGVGVAFSVGRWRLFAQGDYRRILYTGSAENDYRAVAGVRFSVR